MDRPSAAPRWDFTNYNPTQAKHAADASHALDTPNAMHQSPQQAHVYTPPHVHPYAVQYATPYRPGLAVQGPGVPFVSQSPQPYPLQPSSYNATPLPQRHNTAVLGPGSSYNSRTLAQSSPSIAPLIVSTHACQHDESDGVLISSDDDAAPPSKKNRTNATTKSASSNTKQKMPSKKKEKEKKGKKKSTGQGSRSGANRRDAGESEVEIAKLGQETKEMAGLEVDRGAESEDGEEKKHRQGLDTNAKTAVVRWLTASEERWKNYKIKAIVYFNTIHTDILKRKYSVKQIRNYWEGQAWAKYKAVQAMHNHTGGNDPDSDRVDGRSTPDVAAGVNTDDEVDELMPQQLKAKNPKKFGGYTVDVLEKFERSDIYEMIDNVAHDDPDVRRAFEVTSGKPIIPIDDDEKTKGKRKREKMTDPDDELVSLVKVTVVNFEKRGVAKELIDREMLELAKRRELAEAEDRKERREREAQEHEARERERRERLDREAHDSLVKAKADLPRRITEISALRASADAGAKAMADLLWAELQEDVAKLTKN